MQELTALCKHICSPPVFGGVSVARVFWFSVLCFACPRPVSPMLPGPLDCPFVIAHACFSYIYFLLSEEKRIVDAV